MTKKISIIGSGWLGLPFGVSLQQNGFEVKISTTSTDKLSKIKEQGLDAYLLDLDSISELWNRFLEADVLYLITGNKNVGSYQSLIPLIEKSNIKKVVFIGSTSVYPNTNNEVTESSSVNEESPLAQIEKLFRSNRHFDTNIVRFGGLFGYDRKPGNFFRNGKVINNPDGYINLIHRDDCIAILSQLLIKGFWNETINACANTHPTRREFYTKQIKNAGRELPQTNESSTNAYKIVISEKAKSLLNYEFKYGNLMEYEGE